MDSTGRQHIPYARDRADSVHHATEPAGFTIPRDRFIMHQLALTVPERGPLRLGSHLVIREYRAHISDRVLKNSCGSKFSETRAVERKLKRAEDRIRVWRHFAFE